MAGSLKFTLQVGMLNFDVPEQIKDMAKSYGLECSYVQTGSDVVSRSYIFRCTGENQNITSFMEFVESMNALV